MAVIAIKVLHVSRHFKFQNQDISHFYDSLTVNNGRVILYSRGLWSFCELELTLGITLHFIAVSANIVSSQISLFGC